MSQSQVVVLGRLFRRRTHSRVHSVNLVVGDRQPSFQRSPATTRQIADVFVQTMTLNSVSC